MHSRMKRVLIQFNIPSLFFPRYKLLYNVFNLHKLECVS